MSSIMYAKESMQFDQLQLELSVNRYDPTGIALRRNVGKLDVVGYLAICIYDHGLRYNSNFFCP